MRYKAQITIFSGKIRNHILVMGTLRIRIICNASRLLYGYTLFFVFSGCIPINNFFFFKVTVGTFSFRLSHVFPPDTHFNSVLDICLSTDIVTLTFALQVGHQREVTPPVNPIQTPATFIALFDGFKPIHTLADVT